MNTFLVFFILNSNHISTRGGVNLSRFTANIFSILAHYFGDFDI